MWVGDVCSLLVWMSFDSFSLWELTYMHCVYLALWTRKVLCGISLHSFLIFYSLYINFHSFIHTSTGVPSPTQTRFTMSKLITFSQKLSSFESISTPTPQLTCLPLSCFPLHPPSYSPLHPLSISPWYNRNGWLGVKHQVTYLRTLSIHMLHSTWFIFWFTGRAQF